MEGLSKKEIKIISELEFRKKQFFTTKFIDQFTKNKTQRYNVIKNLIKKERIIKLNKNKYYLIPIKARTGKWNEHSFKIADEMMNSEKYYVGGMAAANYWELTDQIPMQIDIYTTKRQGTKKILNTRYKFRRTTNKRIKTASTKQKINNEEFKILKKEETKKWLKSKTSH